MYPVAFKRVTPFVIQVMICDFFAKCADGTVLVPSITKMPASGGCLPFHSPKAFVRASLLENPAAQVDADS